MAEQQTPTVVPLARREWQGMERSLLKMPELRPHPKQVPLLQTWPSEQQTAPQARSGGQQTLLTHIWLQHWPLQHELKGGQQWSPQ